MREPQVRRAAGLAIIAAIILNFLRLTRPGILEYFNPDDTMNLFQAWIAPASGIIRDNLCFWSGATRPLGAAFYKVIHAAFGFHPRPFRVWCFVLLVLNLVLQYRLFSVLWPSKDLAVLALVACSYHAALWSLYASTGTVFDILCATFYLAALVYYMRLPERRFIWRDAMVLAVCAIAAANSKEMAMSLPLAMAAWAVLVRAPGQGRSLSLVDCKAVGTVSVVLAINALGHILNDPVMKLPGYRPVFRLERYLETTKAYLEMIDYRTIALPATAWIAGLVVLLALAVILRSRLAAFGWLFYNLGLLPLSFSEARLDGYVLYIPFIGVVIYAVALVEAGLKQLEHFSSRGPTLIRGVAVSLLAVAVICLQNLEASLLPGRGFGPGGQGLIKTMADDISRAYPSLPHGSRLLLIDDAFGEDRWQPMYVIQLRYNDRTLIVVKQQSGGTAVAADSIRGYDHVFVYDGEHYREWVTAPRSRTIR